MLDDTSAPDASDIGLFERVSVSGVKFNDRNTNGVQDANEPGLAGWTFELYDLSNPAVTLDTVVSDATGAFAFIGLGLVNHLATEYWLLRIITSGEEPTRNEMITDGFSAASLRTGVFLTGASSSTGRRSSPRWSRRC